MSTPSSEARTATHGRASAADRGDAAAPFSAAGLPAHAAGYRALKLWQRALDVAADVHRLSRTFPAGEQDGLGGELRRAAAAVPAAVAAGSLAADRVDHQRALQTAVAAVARVETLVALAERLEFVTTRDAIGVLSGSADVTRLLRGLARFLVTRADGPRTSAPAEPAVAGPVAPRAPTSDVLVTHAAVAEDLAGGAHAPGGPPVADDPSAGLAVGAESALVAAALPSAPPADPAAAPVASGAPAAPPSMRRRTAAARTPRARG